MKYVLWVLFSTLWVIEGDPYSIKRVSDASYRYEFTTTNKKVGPRSHKTYYWFRAGAIHHTQGGVAGELLDGEYVKFYHSNQLAESGTFDKGLQSGLWKSWHENGTLSTSQYWSNGLRTGIFLRYDQNGVLAEKGSYRKGGKHGAWINYAGRDTTWFDRGDRMERPARHKKKQKAIKQSDKSSGQVEKDIRVRANAADTPVKKDSAGFFRRLFKKTKKANGKGQ